MTDEQSERLVRAFERLASAAEKLLAVQFPSRGEPRDAIVTTVKSEEDELRESLGDTGEETIEEWTSIGRREREFLEREGKG